MGKYVTDERGHFVLRSYILKICWHSCQMARYGGAMCLVSSHERGSLAYQTGWIGIGALVILDGLHRLLLLMLLGSVPTTPTPPCHPWTYIQCDYSPAFWGTHWQLGSACCSLHDVFHLRSMQGETIAKVHTKPYHKVSFSWDSKETSVFTLCVCVSVWDGILLDSLLVCAAESEWQALNRI